MVSYSQQGKQCGRIKNRIACRVKKGGGNVLQTQKAESNPTAITDDTNISVFLIMNGAPNTTWTSHHGQCSISNLNPGYFSVLISNPSHFSVSNLHPSHFCICEQTLFSRLPKSVLFTSILPYIKVAMQVISYQSRCLIS